ncbi:molybdopterin-binding protein [Caballeronia sp. LZ008]|uniref:molybdopterin-binding protein n=1 Tax=unclassified Caballeronia TaxID=2646786 RepID=UPI002027D0A0|nr:MULTISPECIES: molybdopterin-binding protein [unclassified Caballeronia]MDR5796562.1 molybdopterin-binding protein [Caballeronia sp. LZ008]
MSSSSQSNSSSPYIEIGGAVQRPLTLDVAAMREFGRVSIEPFDLVCFSTGRYIRPMGSYRGVPLRVLLDAAGVRRPDNTDFKRTVFLAYAHDGYAVTFSWHELFNTPIGAQVIARMSARIANLASRTDCRCSFPARTRCARRAI